ncbi:hypothetical protein PVAP13_4NG163071 [Panicum virgatum]|uniref:Secreted protein n=1 Tax=Panicum virgatum TaxID=38727 RepID=A0A8T0TAA0_PANVG|nr:hypothetical protein PVAP13_4NG163071 [Panicum virgatum]
MPVLFLLVVLPESSSLSCFLDLDSRREFSCLLRWRYLSCGGEGGIEESEDEICWQLWCSCCGKPRAVLLVLSQQGKSKPGEIFAPILAFLDSAAPRRASVHGHSTVMRT